MDVENFSPGFLDMLSQQAEQAIRNRQHKNIHHHYNDSCQRLCNAIGVNSYIRPYGSYRKGQVNYSFNLTHFL